MVCLTRELLHEVSKIGRFSDSSYITFQRSLKGNAVRLIFHADGQANLQAVPVYKIKQARVFPT